MSKYITPQEAQNMFGFHPKTLNRWALAGKIEFIKSPGGHARYSIDSLQSVSHKEDNRKIILYARVSTTAIKLRKNLSKNNVFLSFYGNSAGFWKRIFFEADYDFFVQDMD